LRPTPTTRVFAVKLTSSLYAMVDPAGGHEPVALARILLDAGARVMQLRLKDASSREMLAAARMIAPMCRERGATFIVDDRVDVAMLSGADGVHLGQDDLPLDAARRLVGSSMMIGISTHSVEQAVEAQGGGADYIGFGPIYPGGLRNNPAGKGLEMLSAVRAAVRIPVVAIGGITETTMPDVLAAGADACAIITDVVRAPDIPVKVRALLALRGRTD
jgi:thiamine-phosphate pyrophosphorylase